MRGRQGGVNELEERDNGICGYVDARGARDLLVLGRRGEGQACDGRGVLELLCVVDVLDSEEGALGVGHAFLAEVNKLADVVFGILGEQGRDILAQVWGRGERLCDDADVVGKNARLRLLLAAHRVWAPD